MIIKTNLSQRQFKSGAQIFGCDSIIWSVKTDAKYEGIPKLSVPKQSPQNIPIFGVHWFPINYFFLRFWLVIFWRIQLKFEGWPIICEGHPHLHLHLGQRLLLTVILNHQKNCRKRSRKEWKKIPIFANFWTAFGWTKKNGQIIQVSTAPHPLLKAMAEDEA